MSKIRNIIFLLLLFISISKSIPLKRTINSFRKLQNVYTLDFIYAKNLVFNEKNKWEFEIKYYLKGQNLNDADSNFYLSILYNEESSKALCTINENSTLICEVENDNQKKEDLVKIDFNDAEGATIKWSNLTDVYQIPPSNM